MEIIDNITVTIEDSQVTVDNDTFQPYKELILKFRFPIEPMQDTQAKDNLNVFYHDLGKLVSDKITSNAKLTQDNA